MDNQNGRNDQSTQGHEHNFLDYGDEYLKCPCGQFSDKRASSTRRAPEEQPADDKNLDATQRQIRENVARNGNAAAGTSQAPKDTTGGKKATDVK